MSDWEQLRQFVESGDENAFGQLVNRHLGLVYSAALRQTNDAQTAEEVAQAVFVLLARKARTFNAKVILPAWLFRATRLMAKSALREETRRQRQTTEAMQMQLTEPDPAVWQELVPHLDGALDDLGEKDRQALLLRYFSNQSFKEVASGLQISEDAAKKRVARALEKLRDLLHRKGVLVTVAGLGTLLAGNSTGAAPAGLGQLIRQAALGSGAATSAVLPLVEAGARALFWDQARAILLGSGAALLVTCGLFLAGRTALDRRARVTVNAPKAPSLASAPAGSSSQSENKRSQARPLLQPRQMTLRVVEDADGTPLPRAQVHATFYGGTKSALLDQAHRQPGRVHPCLSAKPLLWLHGLGLQLGSRRQGCPMGAI